MQKAEAEEQKLAMIEEMNEKKKGKTELTLQDLLSGNMPNNLIREIKKLDN